MIYWDVRNSLPHKLVIQSKDGITFTATQSLQRCYLENVADMTYAAVTKQIFEANFQIFELKLHIALVQRP